VDAIGGLTVIVLGVLGLAGVAPTMMIGIATVVFGAALLIQGGTMLSEYARIIFSPGAKASSVDHFGSNSLSVVFLVGAGGIVLGVLALLGIHAMELAPTAVIAFGTALVLSSNAVWHLHLLKHALMTSGTQPTAGESRLVGSEILASEMASGSAGLQALAGLAAIVLGISDPCRFPRPLGHIGPDRKRLKWNSDELYAAYRRALLSWLADLFGIICVVHCAHGSRIVGAWDVYGWHPD
jgi:hypothetical protein